MPIQPIPASAANPPSPRAAAMVARARELEGVFLSEMFAHAGLGESEGAFSGGSGAAQLASFLRQEQARAVVSHGGIGLVALLVTAMAKAESHDQ